MSLIMCCNSSGVRARTTTSSTYWCIIPSLRPIRSAVIFNLWACSSALVGCFCDGFCMMCCSRLAQVQMHCIAGIFSCYALPTLHGMFSCTALAFLFCPASHHRSSALHCFFPHCTALPHVLIVDTVRLDRSARCSLFPVTCRYSFQYTRIPSLSSSSTPRCFVVLPCSALYCSATLCAC